MTPLERAARLRECVRGWQGLLAARPRGNELQAAAERANAVAALAQSIEALAAVGCEVEARFISELGQRLQRAVPEVHALLGQRIDDAAARLASVPWLPRRLAGPVQAYFVRHAEATGNMDQRLHGLRLPGALTANGRVQSRHTAGYLAETFAQLRIGNVLLASSPVGRALETAQEISRTLARPLVTEPGLAELDFGAWSGRYVAGLAAEQSYCDWLKDGAFNAPPDGESLSEVRTRVCEAVARLVAAAAAEGSTLVVVSHYFPLRAVFSLLMPEEAIRPGNGSITAVNFEGGSWQVVSSNYEQHLGSDATPPVAYV